MLIWLVLPLIQNYYGDVWEFKTLYNGKHYRMLAFGDKRNNEDTLIIATHGFIKKVSAVPKQEIDKTGEQTEVTLINVSST